MTVYKLFASGPTRLAPPLYWKELNPRFLITWQWDVRYGAESTGPPSGLKRSFKTADALLREFDGDPG